MIPLAHSAQRGRPGKPYGQHICGVIEKTLKNLGAMAPYIVNEKAALYEEILHSAAALHDLGKLAKENQQVLCGQSPAKRLPIRHCDAGVKYLLGDMKERPEATLVYAHHYPGLPNLGEERDGNAPFRCREAMADSDANLQEYLRLHLREVGRLPEPAENAAPRLSSLEYRILLSCLVDADYSDAAALPPPAAQPTMPGHDQNHWQERSRRLDKYVQRLQACSGQQDERLRMRGLLYHSAKNAATDAAMEYCDSPVGTGKTTAVMAHMLRVAHVHKLRRIFVVLPYTNIITQTVEVLRQAVVLDGEDPEEIVAEHHHHADFEAPEHRHLATAWAAPIIVTTAVQFYETLAGNRPARLRKLHQLPGSGIILDEYHAALPARLMLPAWKWLAQLTDKWGCRICMCSATSVKFWQLPDFQSQAPRHPVPLLSPRACEQLNAHEQSRVQLNALGGSVPHFGSIEALARHTGEYHGPKIIVLGTVRLAAAFAQLLHRQGHDVLHLSTALAPEDRERTIAQVKHRLGEGQGHLKDWTLVATSCVECGMDFSFRYGFCEMRSLQSYIQLGGRVRRNSEAEYTDAALTVFTVSQAGFRPAPEFESARHTFEKMISYGRLSELSVTQAVTEAFRDEYERKAGETSPGEICKCDNRRGLKDVAEKFRVIDEETVTVAATPALVAKIRSGGPVSAGELQRGSVNLRKSVLASLGLPGVELPALSALQYDAFLGYMKSLV